MQSIENNICQAIDIIVDRAIEKAKYDKTVLGQIVSCVDSSIGQYKVKYQNNIWTAYANNTDIIYANGVNVYVLIPEGNFNKDKIIVSVVKQKGVDYINTVYEEEQYETIGSNCIEENKEFSLCSYKTEEIILYEKNNINKIGLSINNVQEYIKNNQASTIKCSANFRTLLNEEQQFLGNYGIIFTLNFKNDDNNITTQDFIIDVNNMEGTPYNFLNLTKQYEFFNIDIKRFIDVESIKLFTKDFPNNKNDQPNDIFISEIALEAVKKINEEDLNTYNLSLSTPDGTFFDNNNITDKRLIAQLKFRGREIEDNNINYYWFIEDVGVKVNTSGYNTIGGEGWRCLNKNDNNTNGWITKEKTLIISQQDIVAKEQKYKCVIIYNGKILDTTIVMKNLSSNFNIQIKSKNGNKFYFGNGDTELICLINGKEEPTSYKYLWAEENNFGQFISLVGNNNKYNVLIKSIIDYSNYKCSVYEGENFKGTVSIVIYNTLNIEGNYDLIINNGTQIFKYDKFGISPTHEGIKSNFEIQPLTFSIYDNSGNSLGEEVLKNCKIKWEIPIENTLLEGPDNENFFIDNDVKVYENLFSLKYKIKDIYNVAKVNNNIKLSVEYMDVHLTTSTNFSFIKEEELSKNGNNFLCKIVPNTNQEIDVPIVINKNINFTPMADGKWFKVQFWKDGIKIFDGVESVNDIIIKWSILKNNLDISHLTVDSSTGVFTCEDYLDNSATSDIIKAEIIYNQNKYYAFYPLQILKTTAEYFAYVKKDTGFNEVIFNVFGKQAQYNNAIPFEIIIKNKNNQAINYNDFTYNFNIKGSDLKVGSLINLNKNQYTIEPNEYYDGYNVNNGFECEILKDNQSIIKLHVPIHLLINNNKMINIKGWDGNKIEILNNSFLLPKMIGLGTNDTLFNGISAGSILNTDGTKETGLFNFYNGNKTFFLNSENGALLLGKDNEGQIILDPSTSKAMISSKGNGLVIDLNNSTIKSGSKFSVNNLGEITNFNLSGNAKTSFDNLVLNKLASGGTVNQKSVTWKSFNFITSITPTISNGYVSNIETTSQKLYLLCSTEV